MSEPEFLSPDELRALTRRQLCAALGVCDSTIRRMELEGMPLTGTGREKRYDLNACKDWARAQYQPQPKRDPVAEQLADPTSALARYFYGPSGKPTAHEPYVPEPELTPHQKRMQREAKKWEAIDTRAALVRFHANKRRAAKLSRTPPWADLDAMRAIYAEAHAKTQQTGIPHHVDHEIPLQGELVSGLHVHNNLQILTGSENSKKRNRFEIT